MLIFTIRCSACIRNKHVCAINHLKGVYIPYANMATTQDKNRQMQTQDKRQQVTRQDETRQGKTRDTRTRTRTHTHNH